MYLQSGANRLGDCKVLHIFTFAIEPFLKLHRDYIQGELCQEIKPNIRNHMALIHNFAECRFLKKVLRVKAPTSALIFASWRKRRRKFSKKLNSAANIFLQRNDKCHVIINFWLAFLI